MSNEESSNITDTAAWKELQSLLVPFFGSNEKFETWMMCENPALGGVMPIDMLFLGREEKLIKFVKQALAENKPKEN